MFCRISVITRRRGDDVKAVEIRGFVRREGGKLHPAESIRAVEVSMTEIALYYPARNAWYSNRFAAM